MAREEIAAAVTQVLRLLSLSVVPTSFSAWILLSNVNELATMFRMSFMQP